MKSLASIKLDPLYQLFPGIKVEQEINDIPRSVPNYHFCRSRPKIRYQPQLYALSRSTSNLLALPYEDIIKDSESSLYLSGATLFEGSQPLAHNYCGYQFGVWAGQLGDGRAHSLGFARAAQKKYELQLKGSGMTPFSRHADGNSVLSSALREFLASELMAGLGIPTTRALSLVLAKEPVKRDPFYDGRIKVERAAIVIRVCESFLRFGSLQVCLPDAPLRQSSPLLNRALLQPLCDFAIQQHFPDINSDEEDPYEALFQRLVRHSAQLVAEWEAIGFCHGVLNTDNMSLGGVTIDYGPFAFLDYFSKDFVSNATDQHERYSFRRQPEVVKWNLERLAEAMDPLFPHSVATKYLQEHFQEFYTRKYYSLMAAKLGLPDETTTRVLVDELVELMHLCGTHFTNFFRLLQEQATTQNTPETLAMRAVECSEPTEFFLKNIRAFPQLIGADYSKILKRDPGFNVSFIEEQLQRMEMEGRLQGQGCKARQERQREKWLIWSRKYLQLRENSQKPIKNPKYVLLNYIARQLIEEVEKATPQESRELLEKVCEVFANPFDHNEWFEQNYWKKPPIPVKLTCSS